MSLQDDPRLTPGQNQLIKQLAAEGDSSPDFTNEEKMALVAGELMDPKEVGLTTADEARLQLVPEAEQPALKLGGGLRLECWTVPLEIRAEWAYQDTKIVLAPADKAAFIEDWQQDHTNTFLIQGRLGCGNGGMTFERTYKDEVLGLVNMIKLAAELLEKKYLHEALPPVSDREESNETTEPAQPVE